MNPVPVHIITGFLGVGKTTALLNLLKKLGPSQRAAVVVNEWGRIGLDSAVVSSQYPDIEVAEVSGGCICCTAGAALDRAVETILTGIAPDRIIIEPSGVAKPGEIIDLFRGHSRSAQLELRPVIAIVDPARFLQPPMMAMPIYRDQVEAAHILVANRCDLLDREVLERFLQKAVELYPPKAAVYTTSFGELPLEVLDPISAAEPSLGRQLPDPDRRPHIGILRHEHYDQDGWTWPPEAVFSYDRLKAFFESLTTELAIEPWIIERAKGVFHTDRGWRLLELASGLVHQREIQWRAENRCQFIGHAKSRDRFDRLKSLLAACRTVLN